MLVEAWLTLKWKLKGFVGEPPRDEKYPLALGKFDTKVKENYSKRVVLDSNNVPPEITPHIPRFQYVNEKDSKKHKLLQIGPGVATSNYLTDYSWEIFQKDAVYLRDALIEAYEGDIDFQFVSLQYRNVAFFDYKNKDMLSFLKKQFGINISMPSNLPGKEVSSKYPTNANFKFSFDIKDPVSKGNFIVATGMKKEDKGNVVPVIVQETEISSELKNIPDIGNDKKFIEWLEKANSVANSWNFPEK